LYELVVDMMVFISPHENNETMPKRGSMRIENRCIDMEIYTVV